MWLASVRIDQRRSENVLDVFAVGHVDVACILHETVYSLYIVYQDKYRARKHKDHGNNAEKPDAIKANEDVYRAT